MDPFNASVPRHKINPFASFWMGGYECTDQLNAFGNRVDLLHTTGHLQQLEQDYRLLKEYNICTAREGIRWSQVEKRPYCYDWSTVKHMLDTGHDLHIQQVWDLCHFGYPDDLTPLHPMFARRFAMMSKDFVKMYKNKFPEKQLIVTPINEVSFISWLGGDTRGTSPYCINMGWEVKYALMRAYIEAVYAMREVDPHVMIMSTEPLVNIVPQDRYNKEQVLLAHKKNEDQFQAMDILTGRTCCELGGAPELLDIQGLNFYYNNQWIDGTSTFLPWYNDNNDIRWKPLSEMINKAYHRYQKPILISETSHCGEHKPNWIEFITKECCKIIEDGIPFWGVCLYPIIDRPDWDHLHQWHDAGLWNIRVMDGHGHDRELHVPYATELIKSQLVIDQTMKQFNPKLLQEEFIHHRDQQAV